MRYYVSFAVALRSGVLNTLIFERVRCIRCSSKVPRQDLPPADKRSEIEDPQVDVWLKPLVVADRKLGDAPVDLDTFLQYMIFQATIALRSMGTNVGTVEFIVAKGYTGTGRRPTSG